MSDLEINNLDIEIINKIELFLKKVDLNSKLKGICILTVGIDRSSLYGCFVFDYDKKVLLKHYPGRYNTNSPLYKNINGINFTINFDYNLPILKEDGKHSGLSEDLTTYPLCCKNCSTRDGLSNDDEFKKFINKSGTSDYIYKIVKKICYGPLQYIKFFTLKNDEIKEVPYTEEENSINSFKIFTCAKHNTYYSITLHSYNKHYTYHHLKGQNETFFGKKIIELL